MRDLPFLDNVMSYIKCLRVLAESGVVRFHKVPSNLILGRSFVGFTGTGRFGRSDCFSSSRVFASYSDWCIAIRRVQGLGGDEGLSLAVGVLSSIVAVDAFAVGGHSLVL